MSTLACRGSCLALWEECARKPLFDHPLGFSLSFSPIMEVFFPFVALQISPFLFDNCLATLLFSPCSGSATGLVARVFCLPRDRETFFSEAVEKCFHSPPPFFSVNPPQVLTGCPVSFFARTLFFRSPSGYLALSCTTR